MRNGVFVCLLACLLLAAPAAADWCEACGGTEPQCASCSQHEYNCDMFPCSCGTPDCIGGGPSPVVVSGSVSDGYPYPEPVRLNDRGVGTSGFLSVGITGIETDSPVDGEYARFYYGSGAPSAGEARTIQDILPSDTLLTRIEMPDGSQDTGGTVTFRYPRGLTEDIDQHTIQIMQSVPLTEESIGRLANPAEELERILSLLRNLDTSKLSSGELEELRKLISTLQLSLENANNALNTPTGTDLSSFADPEAKEREERESRAHWWASGALSEYLDQINRFLNPQQVWISCPTKITNPDNRGALEGEAEVAGFTGTLAVTVLPPESPHRVRGAPPSDQRF